MYPQSHRSFLYMRKDEIKNRTIAINTAKDLAELLNDIKQSEFGTERHRITEKQLKFFSSDTNAPKRYRTFHIKKKSGGLREIKAPCYQLNIILRMLNIALGSVYEPDSVAMGFASGRSVVNNAQMHVGHNYVFNIDLKDFFSSIPQSRVWKRLQLEPFNFSQEIANVIAGLCCSLNSESGLNVLPQGAPTSPLLTNSICGNLDRKMKGVAKRFGLHYSRYADDMTFSSMHNVYQESSAFRQEILRIIEGQGFTINDKKTRLLKAICRQEVTGLTVNAVANVSRKYVKELRWIINAWEKYGYAKAYALFYPRYKYEKGYIKKGEPVMENVIGGKLNYLRMVRGATNAAYKKLQERFDKLQQVTFVGIEEEQAKAKKFMYVQPYSMAEFKDYFNTEVTLSVTTKGKLVGNCAIAGMEKTLAISHSTQDYLCPNIKNIEDGSEVESVKLDECNVILCRAKGKNYWMITTRDHQRDKILSIQNIKINPDGLLDIWEDKGFDAAAGIIGLITRYWGHDVQKGLFKFLIDRYPNLFNLPYRAVSSIKEDKEVLISKNSDRYEDKLNLQLSGGLFSISTDFRSNDNGYIVDSNTLWDNE